MLGSVRNSNSGSILQVALILHRHVKMEKSKGGSGVIDQKAIVYLNSVTVSTADIPIDLAWAPSSFGKTE